MCEEEAKNVKKYYEEVREILRERSLSQEELNIILNRYRKLPHGTFFARQYLRMLETSQASMSLPQTKPKKPLQHTTGALAPESMEQKGSKQDFKLPEPTPEELAQEKAVKDALKAQRRKEEENRAQKATARKEAEMKRRIARINSHLKIKDVVAAAAHDQNPKPDNFFTKPLKNIFSKNTIGHFKKNFLQTINFQENVCGLVNNTNIEDLTFKIFNEDDEFASGPHAVFPKGAIAITINGSFLKLKIIDDLVISIDLFSQREVIKTPSLLLLVVHPDNVLTVHLIKKDGKINEEDALLCSHQDLPDGELRIYFPVATKY